MAPQAATPPSTRLHPPLAQHQCHVWSRRRACHGSSHRQRARRRAGPSDNDATTASPDLLRRSQAYTALSTHRQHAGLVPKRWCWHGVAQGDGSDDDAGKQLPVRVWVPHLVPRYRVSPTRTLAHTSFPDTGCNALPCPPTSPRCCCCCCCRRGGGERRTAQVPFARPSSRTTA